MKQTPECVLCDWFISNSTSKDDVERWMSKDSHYARNTERGYKLVMKHFDFYLTTKNFHCWLFCPGRNCLFDNSYAVMRNTMFISLYLFRFCSGVVAITRSFYQTTA